MNPKTIFYQNIKNNSLNKNLTLLSFD